MCLCASVVLLSISPVYDKCPICYQFFRNKYELTKHYYCKMYLLELLPFLGFRINICDVTKRNKSYIRHCNFFFFFWLKHSDNFVLLKTSSKSDFQFQRSRDHFDHLKTIRYKRNLILELDVGPTSKSIFPKDDSLCLITSHITYVKFKNYIIY